MAELSKEATLGRIKLNLGIEDGLQDELLLLLIDNVINHFKLAYNTEAIDDKFSFIIEDCVVKRFNRRGAEGAKSETVEGHSVSYEEDKYEFLPYDDLLKREFDTGKARDGGVMFL